MILHRQQILSNPAHSQEALGPQGGKVSSPHLLRTSVLVLKLRTSLLEKTDLLNRREESGTTRTTALFLILCKELVHLSWAFGLVLKPTGKQRKHLRSWRSDLACPLSAMPCYAARQQDFTPVAVTALSPAPRWIRSSIRTVTIHFCLWDNPCVPSLPGSVYQFLLWLGQHT